MASPPEILPGLDLHRKVHASKWCITRQQLVEFQEEVRQVWRREITEFDSDTPHSHDGKPHPDFLNPEHTNEKIGPNMHRVNKCFIMPKTRDAGGMSWALMKNEEGLRCQIFATHGWNEGVFEFTSRVLAAWPAGADNIYICFLSNPQNGDIAELLNVAVSKSPFALALFEAKHMLVIPNHKESIYTRLWCVLEAWYAVNAVDSGLVITVPKKINHAVVIEKTILGAVLLLLGFLVGYFALSLVIGNLLGPVMWLMCTYALQCLVSHVVQAIAERSRSVSQETYIMMQLAYVDLCVSGLAAGLACCHLNLSHHPKKSNVWDGVTAEVREELIEDNVIGQRISFQPGIGFPLTMLLISMIVLYLHKIVRVIIDDIVKREDRKLSFETVRKANCTASQDKENIMAEIKGNEDNIDKTINMLRKVGRYDTAVRYNLERGMSFSCARAGINPAQVAVSCCAWTFWWLTDLCARDRDSAACALLATVLVAAFFFAYYIGEQSVFAIHCAFIFGILFVIYTNDDKAFNTHVPKDSDMSMVTLLSQAMLFGTMLAVDIYFYSGVLNRIALSCASWWHWLTSGDDASQISKAPGQQENVSKQAGQPRVRRLDTNPRLAEPAFLPLTVNDRVEQAYGAIESAPSLAQIAQLRFGSDRTIESPDSGRHESP